MVAVGKILKPQGIGGQVKVLPYSNSLETMAGIAVTIGGSAFRIIKATRRQESVFLDLDGVCDRNQAELLRGKEVFVNESELPPLEEYTYYVTDLIGSKIICEEKEYGVIEAVSDYGAAEVVSAKNGEAKFSFPLLKKLIVDFDATLKILTVDKDAFVQVAVYED